jgi:hypothetical protein
MTGIPAPYIGSSRTEVTPTGVLRIEADNRSPYRIAAFCVGLMLSVPLGFWVVGLLTAGLLTVLVELLVSPRIVEICGAKQAVMVHRRYFGRVATKHWISFAEIKAVAAVSRTVMQAKPKSRERYPTDRTAYEALIVRHDGSAARLFEGSEADRESAELIARRSSEVIGVSAVIDTAAANRSVPTLADVVEQHHYDWNSGVLGLLIAAFVGIGLAGIGADIALQRATARDGVVQVMTDKCEYTLRRGKKPNVVSYMQCGTEPYIVSYDQTLKREWTIQVTDRRGNKEFGAIYLREGTVDTGTQLSVLRSTDSSQRFHLVRAEPQSLGLLYLALGLGLVYWALSRYRTLREAPQWVETGQALVASNEPDGRLT